MPDKANVASLEALESFLHNLVVYREKAATTIDEARSEVQRFETWLKHDQKTHWQREVRLRGRALEQARQDLFRSRLASLQSGSTAEVAYQRARASLREAESKLATVKAWNLACESRLDPLIRQIDRMHNLLAEDLPHALAYLSQIVTTLGDYADRAPAGSAGALAGPPADAAPRESDPPAGAPL